MPARHMAQIRVLHHHGFRDHQLADQVNQAVELLRIHLHITRAGRRRRCRCGGLAASTGAALAATAAMVTLADWLSCAGAPGSATGRGGHHRGRGHPGGGRITKNGFDLGNQAAGRDQNGCAASLRSCARSFA